jgi:hypothetical protein
LDGAYILMKEEGYREAMVGNISLYDVTPVRGNTPSIWVERLNMASVGYFPE